MQLEKQNASERAIAYLALLCGISISAVAIYYSVAGLVSIFAASVVPIIVMGVTLEVSKLIATLWLKINWFRAPRLIKTYLLTAIAILMVITSMGIFGYLSKAHLDQSLISGDVAARLTVINEKIALEEEKIADSRKSLAQLDVTVEQTLGRSKTEMGVFRAEQLKRSQNKDRNRIRDEIEASQTVIAKLKEERAPILSEMRKVEAEVGPIKYIASVIYGETPDTNLLEKAVTWVIIVIVVVFDPLAVVLLLASQYSFQWFRSDKQRAIDNAARAIELEEERRVQAEKDRIAAETESLKHQLELQLLANQIAEAKAKEVSIVHTAVNDTNTVIHEIAEANQATAELVNSSLTDDSLPDRASANTTVLVPETEAKVSADVVVSVTEERPASVEQEEQLTPAVETHDEVQLEPIEQSDQVVNETPVPAVEDSVIEVEAVFETDPELPIILAQAVDRNVTPILDLKKRVASVPVEEMLDVKLDDQMLETLISDLEPTFIDLDRPGDYLANDPLFEIAEDNVHHPDEKSSLKAAKSRWKKENPQRSLKYQRELLQKGFISRLPWEVPEYVAAVEALEAAEEAAKWAQEQLEQTPDDESVIETAKWANEQLEIHYQQLEDTAQKLEDGETK